MSIGDRGKVKLVAMQWVSDGGCVCRDAKKMQIKSQRRQTCDGDVFWDVGELAGLNLTPFVCISDRGRVRFRALRLNGFLLAPVSVEIPRKFEFWAKGDSMATMASVGMSRNFSALTKT